MSVRRIAEFIPLVVTVLVALPAHAQSRPADQLYIPIVAHVGTYSTDLTVTNLGTDRVSINLLFAPNNGPVNPNGWRLNVLTLDPGESSKPHEIGEFGIAGQGQLVIDACKVGAFCSPSIDPASDPLAQRYRENAGAMRVISASARIYSSNGLGTRGDSIVATPWHALPGADLVDVGMDRVQVGGIKSDARYGTQIGLVNGSQFSATFLTAILRDGMNVEYARASVRLDPMESTKQSAEQMFPNAFGTNRLNRTTPISNPWIEVIQAVVIPTEQAAAMVGCENGCPRFDAYASVTDSASGDFSIRTSEFETEGGANATQSENSGGNNSRVSLAGIHGLSSDRLAKEGNSATSEVTLPCSITGGFKGTIKFASGEVHDVYDFTWNEAFRNPVTGKDEVRVKMHLTAQELSRLPPEVCGATHFEAR